MGFQEWVRRRPLWSSVAAVVAFAIVTFPAWLATIWPLFSNRPFVEVMGDQGWGWLVIGPAYGWISLALLLACLAVLFVILGTTLNVKQPVAPVSGFSPVSERPIRILERYYQRLLQIRQRAEDAKIEGDLYAARVSLNELRGELINFAPQTLSTATAMDLHAPSKTPFRDTSDTSKLLSQDEYRKELVWLIDHLLSQLHRKWVVSAGPSMPTP